MTHIRLKLTTILFIFLSIGKASGSFVWDQMADFGGGNRALPFAFSIGSYGYAGGGSSPADHNDFWQYDPANNTWTQKANYPGAGRYGIAGFSIGNYGYAGVGWSGSGGGGAQYNDFWRYDPSINSWSQKANLGATGRYGAVCFSIGDKGYLGLGYTPFLNDFWEYDPGTDSWSQKTDFPGNPRTAAIGVTIAGKGYVGGGYSGLADLNDFYEFDPVNNSWTRKSDIPGLRRRNPAGFSIGNYGYVGMGYNDTTYLTDFSQYNPATDQWATVASIGGVPRYACFSFVVDNYGYVGGGSYGGTSTPIFTNGVWRFGDCDGSPVGIILPPISENRISMSVTSDFRTGLILNYDIGDEREAVFNFYNSLGQLILTSNLLPNSHQTSIAIPLSSDIYLYSVSNNERKLTGGKVIVN